MLRFYKRNLYEALFFCRHENNQKYEETGGIAV